MGFTFLLSSGFVTLHTVYFQSRLWKKRGVSGWWAKLFSNLGITNWKDVSVFYPFVQHSKIQHPHIFLGYPVLLAFLSLCFMCNTQKMTKCQTSALGNAFITYLCYFFFIFCFLLLFLPLGDNVFWPLVIFAPLVLILHVKKIPECYCKSHLESFWFSLPRARFMKIFVPKDFLSLPAQNIEAWWLLCLYVFQKVSSVYKKQTIPLYSFYIVKGISNVC